MCCDHGRCFCSFCPTLTLEGLKTLACIYVLGNFGVCQLWGWDCGSSKVGCRVREDPWVSRWAQNDLWKLHLSKIWGVMIVVILEGQGKGLVPGLERRRGLFGSSWLQVQGVMVVVSSWAKEPSGPGGLRRVRGPRLWPGQRVMDEV